ncbi:hypothetical protein CIB48_g9855 [Xylaria polymorpha]|nr:hypothetical protein CIB48_g9855 [Xylaria polymorpha]
MTDGTGTGSASITRNNRLTGSAPVRPAPYRFNFTLASPRLDTTLLSRLLSQPTVLVRRPSRPCTPGGPFNPISSSPSHSHLSIIFIFIIFITVIITTTQQQQQQQLLGLA